MCFLYIFQVELTLVVKVSAVYLASAMLLSLLGNSLLLLTCLANRHLRQSHSNCYFMSLSMAHLAMTMTSMPLTLLSVLYKSDLFDALLCKLNLFMVLALQGRFVKITERSDLFNYIPPFAKGGIRY